MVFEMMDGKTELLVVLLQCGYADIDTLIDVMNMGNELFDENLVYDVIDEYGSEALEFNSLLYHLMTDIVSRLVRELDDDRLEVIIENNWSGIYTNFMDSHFNLECLDNWAPGIDRIKLLNALREEIFAMEK
jgi:hypothetical protein